MTAERQREYTWYVEPLGDVAYVNKVIAEGLGEEVDNAKSFCESKVCYDGKPRNMWNCSREDAKRFWDSRDSLHIKICVWSKEGDGQIRPVNFLFGKNRMAYMRRGKPASAGK